MLVNNALFFAAHASTAKNTELGILGGLKTCLCGGEGFVMKFRGPCVVYTQSRDPRIINRMIAAKNQRKQQRNATHSKLMAS